MGHRSAHVRAQMEVGRFDGASALEREGEEGLIASIRGQTRSWSQLALPNYAVVAVFPISTPEGYFIWCFRYQPRRAILLFGEGYLFPEFFWRHPKAERHKELMPPLRVRGARGVIEVLCRENKASGLARWDQDGGSGAEWKSRIAALVVPAVIKSRVRSKQHYRLPSLAPAKTCEERAASRVDRFVVLPVRATRDLYPSNGDVHRCTREGAGTASTLTKAGASVAARRQRECGDEREKRAQSSNVQGSLDEAQRVPISVQTCAPFPALASAETDCRAGIANNLETSPDMLMRSSLSGKALRMPRTSGTKRRFQRRPTGTEKRRSIEAAEKAGAKAPGNRRYWRSRPEHSSNERVPQAAQTIRHQSAPAPQEHEERDAGQSGPTVGIAARGACRASLARNHSWLAGGIAGARVRRQGCHCARQSLGSRSRNDHF